jgi:TolB-like protein
MNKGMERKLAAILVADVAGYSSMMERDESGTFAQLRAHRTELIEPTVATHRGRIFKLTGDGLLAEFGSIVDAVECAAAIQQGMAERNRDISDGQPIELRIGVHAGDVIVEGDDRHGDAVNVAARLQEVAERGGICVSMAVVDQVRQKVALVFDLHGEQRLKNIAEPIKVYRVRLDERPAAPRAALTLPDRPSIAVLPFTNMSGDPEQEYFADGIAEEIITDLSRMTWLFVIARNSSFTYKGRAVDVKQVGRELGVRYVLEGSVRKGGDKVRITGQLINAETGAHIWGDRFDGGLEDVFDLQDRVTASVVGAIAPKLEQAEIERVMRKPTDSLDAYDYYLRGLAHLHRWTRDDNAAAVSDFKRAIGRDPKFAAAYGMAARCYAQSKVGGWVDDRTHDIADAEQLARRAVELGKEDAVALSAAGFALADVVGKVKDGDAFIERALALNRNLAWAWTFSGWTKIWLGKPEVAMDHVALAMRLSPHDPHMFLMQAAMATAAFFADRHGEALSWAEMALRDKPDMVLAACVAALCHAHDGRNVEMRQAIDRLLAFDPALRLANLEDRFAVYRPEDHRRWVEGLRKAGLPE